MPKSIICPYCGDTAVVKNGKANGVPRCKCKHCKHNFPIQRCENGNAFHNSNTKKGAIVAYLSGKDLKEYSKRCGIPRSLIYYWVKQFKKRIFYTKGVQKNIGMTEDQKWAYKLLGKRRLSMNIRMKYNKTISKDNPIRPYKKILEYLAKNYDLLPTKRDKLNKEELERILNQDPNDPDYFLRGIQGLYFSDKKTIKIKYQQKT